MKKNPAKQTNPKSKNTFSPTEVGTLIDQLRGEFKVFGEDLASVKADVKSTKEMVGKNVEQITLLEIAVRNMAVKINGLTASIDKLIKTKADQQDFQTLEKRVADLEAKVLS